MICFDARKKSSGVWEQVMFKSASTATETSENTKF